MYISEFGCESDLAFSKCIGGDYEAPYILHNPRKDSLLRF